MTQKTTWRPPWARSSSYLTTPDYVRRRCPRPTWPLDKNIQLCLIPHSDWYKTRHSQIRDKKMAEWMGWMSKQQAPPHYTQCRWSAVVKLENRRDQVILTRCRIGHSRLTHGHLLKGELAPECIPCQCPRTLRHVLVECTDFSHIRPNFYRKTSLRSLLGT